MPFDAVTPWEYLASFQRLLLALALGLLIGGERERAGKEVGLRTFAFVALIGALSATLDHLVMLAAVGTVALLIVFLNLRALVYEQTLEMTTSAALVITLLIGILAGLGQTFEPTAVGVLTAALLAAKVPLHGFTLGLTPQEVRAALLFGIIAFVIYPVLPPDYVDPWQLVNLSNAWLTVVLIAGIGMINYVLLRLYGQRGLSYAIFLGGLVNSSIAVAELARRLRLTNETNGDGSSAFALHGIAVANSAMLLRNGAILAILHPAALLVGAPIVSLMLVVSLVVALATDRHARQQAAPAMQLAAPFSLRSALYFGAILVGVAIVGDLAQRTFGDAGFYVASIAGGLVSSASTTASAALLAGQGKLSPDVAGLGAVLASMTSAAVHAPLLWQAAKSRRTGWRVVQLTAGTLLLALVGLGVQCGLPPANLTQLLSAR